MFEYLMSLAKAFADGLISKEEAVAEERRGTTHVWVREFSDGRQVAVGPAR